MITPDLRQLRQFVAVAEHLHFGRAAQALHISQPPLSRSIQDLEAKLGARLFERSRRKVELTPAGRWYLEEARQVLARLERASRAVAELAAGGAGSLRIGFVTIADYSVLPALLSRFKAAQPGVTLSLRELVTEAQLEALAAGDLDLGFVLPPLPGREVDSIAVNREPLVIALPARHPLAATQGPLGVRTLADEPFVMVPASLARGLSDVVLGLCTRAGFAPRIAQEAVQMQTVVSLVSSGLGVAIVPASLLNLRRSGVIYRAVRDAHPKIELRLAWRRDARSAALTRFVALARRNTK
ncbi:MAG: LysR family transcriptional regulator [Betaproteobacteria bacterium]